MEGPLQGLGVEDEFEKEASAGNGENMVEGAALAIGVVEAYFDNAVVFALPGDFDREGLSQFMVKVAGDWDRNFDALDHLNPNTTRICSILYTPEYDPKSSLF